MERAIRRDLLSAGKHCGASLQEVYVEVRDRGAHVVDHMYRDYQSHKVWLAGMECPPRCPLPGHSPRTFLRAEIHTHGAQPGRLSLACYPRHPGQALLRGHTGRQGRWESSMLKPPSRDRPAPDRGKSYSAVSLSRRTTMVKGKHTTCNAG